MDELIIYDPSNKDSNGLTLYFSIDSSTSVNSVFLVSDLKTPSSPSSVHITPIIPSQSLVPSTDKVIKEKKDVSISLIHFFQGDMDLHLLSFQASLEEKWDEEEES
ncbi:hypothetical protein O181_021208 [Austropuccinia psidii MF-1]|uniref:Uncharacterized protein n=1 Tax=Austropuccinia psidii MF-1 TaxID=1389203 RepID=A0A9Q3GV82_9BASI|nr:hypothetical protein [Austropuccinia psidii MF-1]